MEWVTVSARIRRELYEKLRRYNINISGVIRKALEEEIERREEEEAREALRRAQEILKKLRPDDIVEAVRSGREER